MARPAVAVISVACIAFAAPATQPWPILLQGHEDVDPLGRSLFNQPQDLRAPIGFEQVYDLGDGRLARIDGGIFAVFPRSTYAPGRSGLEATIPPGTVFYIGAPPRLSTPIDDPFGLGTPRPTVASRFAAEERATLVGGPVGAPGPARFAGSSRPVVIDHAPRHVQRLPATTIFNSEAERHRVVGSLIERARLTAGPP